jgi:hypothetical protein
MRELQNAIVTYIYVKCTLHRCNESAKVFMPPEGKIHCVLLLFKREGGEGRGGEVEGGETLKVQSLLVIFFIRDQFISLLHFI